MLKALYVYKLIIIVFTLFTAPDKNKVYKSGYFVFLEEITKCSLNNAGMHAQSRSTLEVPIFWFLHSEPLLVDKHYQAKALSDMVIVVQSETSSWESHMQCNGNSLLWDLRLQFLAI